MNPYRFDITAGARRQLKVLFPESLRQVILAALLALRDDPMPPESELQRELAGRFRLKIDGWRILYKVNETDRIVTILAIRPRGSSTYLNVP